MELEELEKLIEEYKKLPPIKYREKTFFSIGGKGYYENPTSDVLAFFLDSKEEHGLGNLIGDALFTALKEKARKPRNFKEDDKKRSLSVRDQTVKSSPGREISYKRKRIDLLLEGEDWVMIIENKIFHEQINQFDLYMEYAKKTPGLKDKAHKIFVVLSPDGTAINDNWYGLSYGELIECIKKAPLSTLIEQPPNKWVVLLRELIINLEEYTMNDTVLPEVSKFIFNNSKKISELITRRKKAMEDFHSRVISKVKLEIKGANIHNRTYSWAGGKALHFWLDTWEKDKAYAVLYFDEEKDHYFSVWCCVFNVQEEEYEDFHAKILDMGEKEFCDPADKVRHQIRLKLKKKFEVGSIEDIAKEISHQLNQMNTLLKGSA